MGGILSTVITLLVLFWVVGLVLHVAGPMIHFALLAAAVLFVINRFSSARAHS